MDTPPKSENSSYYPHLPAIPCPRNLFISLISKTYLSALYIIEPSVFPQNWTILVKISPMGAWNALNQAVIQYLNARYSSQGLRIGKSETAILSLAQKISENVSKDIQNIESCSTTRSSSPLEGEFDLLVEKLQIVFDIVESQVAKLTGREVTIHISTDGKVLQKQKVIKGDSCELY